MAPTTGAMRARAAASSDRLPPDVLFAFLLRLPARELCHLRAVCRSWRSLASDPVFIRAHADRHREPLFLAKFRGDAAHVYVVDLAGNVLKRVAGAADGGHQVLPTRLSLACLATDWNRCRVLNPATRAIQILPPSPAPEHKNRVNLSDPYTFFALGFVASTGEYKVLRMFNRLGFLLGGEQLFELFTVDSGTGQSCWRAKPKHNLFVDAPTGVVVDAVVYFLISREYSRAFLTDIDTAPDYIISFDLGREEWRNDLRGPIGNGIYAGVDLFSRRHYLALAELKGSLVLVYKRLQQLTFVMDLWFLMDSDNGFWSKEYTVPIPTELIVLYRHHLNHIKPILVLNDGRLVLHQVLTGLLHIWDPQSNSFTQVNMRQLDSVGMYTESLLSLQ